MAPATSVISTRDTAVDAGRQGYAEGSNAVGAAAGLKANASVIVAAPPGDRRVADGVPSPSVVTVGVTGEPVGTTPVA
jgi:hypothetical protein